MRRPVKAMLFAGLAIAVATGVAYAAWTHSGYVTIEDGISIGVDADPGAKTIRFEDCGLYDAGYIEFSDADDNYIIGLDFGGIECLHLHAGHLMMESEDSGASVVVDQYGDVVITLGS